VGVVDVEETGNGWASPDGWSRVGGAEESTVGADGARGVDV